MRIAIAPVLALMSLTPLVAQETTATTATAIPHLVRYTGTFHPANGLPVGPTESATLSIYAEEQGGTPLWQETQNVALDADGHYTAVLGATQNDGVPTDLFSASAPRWLGVTFNRPGETEQARVQLVSVPYAMRAADAETLGGRPASSYLLDPNAGTAGSASGGTTTATSSASAKSLKAHETFGTTNYIPYFTDTSGDFANSVLYQSGSRIGIDTTNPVAPLNLLGPNSNPSITSDTGLAEFSTANSLQLSIGGLQNSPYTFWLQTKQAYNTGNSYALALNPLGGNVGIGTTSPVARLNVLGPNSNPSITSDTGLAEFSTANSLQLSIGGLQNSPYTFWLQTKQAYNDGNYYALALNPLGGGVGIGTTTPVAELDVAGNINFSGLISYQGSPALTVNGTNAAVGSNALTHFTTGSDNSAIGSQALSGNTTGTENTGIGYFALNANTAGYENTAIGAQALQVTNGTGSSSGSGNTAIGWAALLNNQTGNSNIGIGLAAGSNITSTDNNIDIGSPGANTDNGVIRFGNTGIQTAFYVAGVRGVTTGVNDAIEVMIDSNGQLGTVSSSRRYKEDIQDMGDISSGLMKLRPVTFRYKKPFADGSKPIQYGLIAEEVAEVYPDLVAHSADGQIETVKYQLLDSMLLNEVKKQQHQIGQQEDQIQKLEEQNHALQERLEKLEAAIEAGSR